MGGFTPVGPEIWRWDTPDPEDDWLMVGHLMLAPRGAVLIDPPLVPSLADHLTRLGGVQAVVLTTHDHTRGAGWLQRWLHCPVYVPLFSLGHPLIQSKIPKATPYQDGALLPGGLAAERIRVIVPMWDDDESPYVDEMALFTPQGAVVTGDIAMGGPSGQLCLCPEGLSHPAAAHKVQASLSAFQALMSNHPDTHTLLAAHGQDLVGTLAAELRHRVTGI